MATLAGNCSVPGFADGRPAEARFGRSITSLKCLPNCSLLVPDAETGHLRRGVCAGGRLLMRVAGTAHGGTRAAQARFRNN